MAHKVPDLALGYKRKDGGGTLSDMRERVAGRELYLGTSRRAAQRMRLEGSDAEYTTLSTERADPFTDVRAVIDGSELYPDTVFPDPTTFWGVVFADTKHVTVGQLLQFHGIEWFIGKMERWLNSDVAKDYCDGDPTDPDCYDIVVIGRIPASAVLRIEGNTDGRAYPRKTYSMHR